MTLKPVSANLTFTPIPCDWLGHIGSDPGRFQVTVAGFVVGGSESPWNVCERCRKTIEDECSQAADEAAELRERAQETAVSMSRFGGFSL